MLSSAAADSHGTLAYCSCIDTQCNQLQQQLYIQQHIARVKKTERFVAATICQADISLGYIQTAK